MKFDLKIIQKYIDDGLLEVQSHGTLPLKIYNYTRTCAWEKKWDEITTQCRGLILDHDGNLVAKSFNKFFNYEEINPSEINYTGKCYTQDKEDGSLGILFNYNGEWIFASKGSFTSDQSIKAKEIFYSKYKIENCLPCYTYIFEIIYPENRIVLDYGDEEKLILLTILEGQKEKSIQSVKIASALIGFPYVHTGENLIENADDLEEVVHFLRNQNLWNKEGFVIRFLENNYRIKIKFEEYVRLHRLLTNFSNVDIWEVLKNGEDFKEFLDRVPDEFDEWVQDIIDGLKSEYNNIEREALNYYKVLRTKGYADKAKKAKWIQKHVSHKLQSIIYSMVDRRDYSRNIWRMIRPTYIKPLWNKPVEV